MNKKELSLKRKFLREENSRYPIDGFIDIPKDKWPYPQPRMFRVMRSYRFLCQLYHLGDIIRISVNRAEMDNAGNWKDGISWDDLQWIKSQCGFEGRDAVEVYPADADMVNVANMRHIWVFPPDYKLSFAWRQGDDIAKRDQDLAGYPLHKLK